MNWRTKQRGKEAMSGLSLGVLGVFAALGLYVFYRELPSLRRYIRLKRM